MSKKATPNWTAIKGVWISGMGDLNKVAQEYNITLPDIFLRAAQDEWPPRDSAKNILADNLKKQVFDSTEPILTDQQVILAHKTDLGRLRLIAATILETLQQDEDIKLDVLLKASEKLSRIYSQIIPLERKVYSIDVGTDGAPDGIIININGKSQF